MEPHPDLVRDGDDLRYRLEVGFAQAALGCHFEVPTLDGPEVVEVRPGTQSGTELRIPGKGMPRLRQVGSGDQIVTVVIATPKRLSAKARALLEAYAQEVGEPMEERATLVEKLRGLFGRRGDVHGRDGDRDASRDDAPPG